MKTISTLLLFSALSVPYSWTQPNSPSPFAAPPTKLEFKEATAENFPFKTFIRQKNQELSFEGYGKFSYHKTDLNGDGKDEWIVAMKDDYPQGPVSIWIFAEREGSLIRILKTHSYFTIIPRKESYPDIEEWHHSGQYTSRLRWSYDSKNERYDQLWTEHYFDNLIVETILRKKES